MLRTTIAALLSIGTLSTPALAQPMQRDGHRNDSYSQRYDRGYQGRRWNDRHHRLNNDWMQISYGEQLRPDRRAFIKVDDRAPRLSVVRIDPVRGPMFIEQVAVQFQNGRTVTVKPYRQLANGAITVDLGGERAVNRIIVYGRDGGRGSEFSVSAR